jgi:hypothetical protein
MDCTVQPSLPFGWSPSGGMGPDGGAGAPGEVTLTGQVAVYADETFDVERTALYGDQATIEADGPAARVRATWDGASSFALGPLSPRTENWVAALPASTRTVLPTLYPIDTTRSRHVLLPLVSASTLDLIFDVVTLPVARQSNRGHAVLFVKDVATRAPIAGVRITQAESELVAYAVAGGFSDRAGEVTDASGLVVLGNVAAEPYPTGSLRQVLLGGKVSGRAELKVVADGVTVAEILAPR